MSQLPPLAIEAWQPTRDSLHEYSKALGAIRRQMAPPQPHWWHISLLPVPTGLSTGALPAGDGQSVELVLDLERHQLVILASDGRRWGLPLDGRPAAGLAEAALEALAELGASPEPDLSKLNSDVEWAYDRLAAGAWWQAARRVAGALTAFSAELPGQKSPVLLWPHHFDLSMVWFSGRLVPGVDPKVRENAQEQMGFGFSTGDASMPEPYFYLTAYPWPESIVEAALPAPATWFTETWKGGLLRYADLAAAEQPMTLLTAVLRASQAAGAARMPV